MRAFVKKDVCIGCGFCTATVPEVFEMDDDGKAVAVSDTTKENKEAVKEAVEGCPVEAIEENV